MCGMLVDKIRLDHCGVTIILGLRAWYLWWTAQIATASTKPDKNCIELSTIVRCEMPLYLFLPINKTSVTVSHLIFLSVICDTIKILIKHFSKIHVHLLFFTRLLRLHVIVSRSLVFYTVAYQYHKETVIIYCLNELWKSNWWVGRWLLQPWSHMRSRRSWD